MSALRSLGFAATPRRPDIHVLELNIRAHPGVHGFLGIRETKQTPVAASADRPQSVGPHPAPPPRPVPAASQVRPQQRPGAGGRLSSP